MKNKYFELVINRLPVNFYTLDMFKCLNKKYILVCRYFNNYCECEIEIYQSNVKKHLKQLKADFDLNGDCWLGNMFLYKKDKQGKYISINK